MKKLVPALLIAVAALIVASLPGSEMRQAPKQFLDLLEPGHTVVVRRAEGAYRITVLSPERAAAAKELLAAHQTERQRLTDRSEAAHEQVRKLQRQAFTNPGDAGLERRLEEASRGFTAAQQELFQFRPAPELATLLGPTLEATLAEVTGRGEDYLTIEAGERRSHLNGRRITAVEEVAEGE